MVFCSMKRWKSRFFIALFMMSKFIWNIEVKGNTRISKIEILEELSKNGLKIGTYKGKINANSVINKIRLDREDIAWIGIDIEGTNAIVEIKETSKAPEIINWQRMPSCSSSQTSCQTPHTAKGLQGSRHFPCPPGHDRRQIPNNQAAARSPARF